jgi:molybdenum cofactor biosynthesis enzyme MoaA
MRPGTHAMTSAAAGSGSSRPPLPLRLLAYARREADRVTRIADQEVGTAVARARQEVQRLRHDGPVPASEDRILGHQWQWSACYAPLTSMYLDQFGKARACCQNTGHLLGDISTSTLREIWDGAATAELRRALGRDDLGLGCEFCAWQQDEAGTAAFARTYDDHAVGFRSAPRWPRQLEFSISNTCNLQCVMCNGDWSSSIRAQREGRPALPSAYPERFYDELVEFIPHLHQARFTGGEPFLGREPRRVLDLLLEHGTAELGLVITTNGTTMNDRVEATVDGRPTWIVLSLDGGTKEAYERVRIGADFDEVLANLDRFLELTSHHEAGVSLTHCLMTDNWQTFPELLFFAEERGLEVAINTVRFPEAHSLYHLPPETLAEVATTLDARTSEVERRVTGSRRELWHQQVHALATRAHATAWPEALGVPPEALANAGTAVALGPTRRTRR